MTRRTLFAGVLALAAAGRAWAEELPLAAAPSEALPRTAFDLLARSGWVGLFLGLMSLVMVALILEHYFTLRRDRLLPPDVLGRIEEALDNGEYEQAAELCEEKPCLMTDVIAAGLEKIPNGPARMADAMEGEAEAQAAALHQQLNWLSGIAVLAPMFGLLGTVAGLITAFGELARDPLATPDKMAGGIYVALMTTLEGLAVAIPATAAALWFRGRASRIMTELSLIAADILDRFRPIADDPG